MISYKKVTETIDGKNFSLETGKLAKQANGSIFAQLGETQVLATVVSAKDPVDDNFLPLTVNYQEKAFAAGADIKEMRENSFSEMYQLDWFAQWDGISQIRKPIIAVVSGYALGGGCELALMCDFILASKTAKFGQPEISLGIIISLPSGVTL